MKTAKDVMSNLTFTIIMCGITTILGSYFVKMQYEAGFWLWKSTTIMVGINAGVVVVGIPFLKKVKEYAQQDKR